MEVLRKIVAVILMILAIFGFVVCIGAMIGGLTARQTIIDGTIAGLAVANQLSGITNRAAQAAEGPVERVNQRLTSIDERLGNLRDDQRSQIDSQIKELAEPIGQIGETLGRVGPAVNDLDATLRTVSRLPGIDIQPLPPQIIEATARVDRLSTRFNDLNAAVNDRNFDGSNLRERVNNVRTEVQAIQTNLQQAQTRLTVIQRSIQTLQRNTATYINLGLAGLSLFLLLLAGGQAALFKVSWDWFRKP